MLVNIKTAALGCARYFANCLVPVDLNASYLHPGNWSAWTIFFALALLLSTGLLFSVLWRENHLPLTCWLLFAVGLLPVLQIIPAGHCYMADRYAYVPTLWIFVILGDFLSRWAAAIRIPSLCKAAAGTGHGRPSGPRQFRPGIDVEKQRNTL